MKQFNINKIPLGLGGWVFGGRDWGLQNDRDSLRTIKTAFEKGITHFDTAQAYGRGHSEEIIGKALKDVREKVFIASKAVFTLKEKVLPLIELSLRRLKTDYIDLYYIHWPTKNTDLCSVMEQLLIAKEKGLIRGIGVSNFSIQQMQTVMKCGKIDAHQLGYNLLWRWAEKEIIPFCLSNNIKVIAYSALAQGILTGKFSQNLELPDTDHRKKTVLFEKDVYPYILEGIEKLKRTAGKVERPLVHLALRWVTADRGVSLALAGARNSKQLEQNIAAFDGNIDKSILEEMTAISDSIIKHIPDTGNFFRWYP